jgi:hypothetical protein
MTGTAVMNLKLAALVLAMLAGLAVQKANSADVDRMAKPDCAIEAVVAV